MWLDQNNCGTRGQALEEVFCLRGVKFDFALELHQGSAYTRGADCGSTQQGDRSAGEAIISGASRWCPCFSLSSRFVAWVSPARLTCPRRLAIADMWS